MCLGIAIWLIRIEPTLISTSSFGLLIGSSLLHFEELRVTIFSLQIGST